MKFTNTIQFTEKQEDFFLKVVENKLTKLGFEENDTHHFCIVGRNFNLSLPFVERVIFEFGNGDDFFHVSCELNKNKGIKIKTLTLEKL
jgi:hypothetical protein